MGVLSKYSFRNLATLLMLLVLVYSSNAARRGAPPGRLAAACGARRAAGGRLAAACGAPPGGYWRPLATLYLKVSAPRSICWLPRAWSFAAARVGLEIQKQEKLQ